MAMVQVTSEDVTWRSEADVHRGQSPVVLREDRGGFDPGRDLGLVPTWKPEPNQSCATLCPPVERLAGVHDAVSRIAREAPSVQPLMRSSGAATSTLSVLVPVGYFWVSCQCSLFAQASVQWSLGFVCGVLENHLSSCHARRSLSLCVHAVDGSR